jgi:hypothetical protein
MAFISSRYIVGVGNRNRVSIYVERLDPTPFSIGSGEILGLNRFHGFLSTGIYFVKLDDAIEVHWMYDTNNKVITQEL